VDLPETRYAKSGDVNVAYQVIREGPFDLVFVPGLPGTSSSSGGNMTDFVPELAGLPVPRFAD
jgi:hypothetical protein